VGELKSTVAQIKEQSQTLTQPIIDNYRNL